MKKLCIWLGSLFPLFGWAQTSGEANLSVSLQGFAKQPVVIVDRMSDSVLPDTLAPSDNGAYAVRYALQKPMDAFLHVMDGEENYSYCLYLTPGNSLVVSINSTNGKLETSFRGDTGKESAYENLRWEMCTLSSAFSEEAWMKLADFRACRQYVETQQQRMKKALQEVKDTLYIAAGMKTLREEVPGYYFQYAVTRQKSGAKMENDADFMDFVKQIDVNDTTQLALTSHYLDWYVVAFLDTDGMPDAAAKLRYAETLVKNQTVRNALADEALTMIALGRMFGADMSSFSMPIYKEFLKLSTNDTLCASIRTELRTMENQEVGAEAVDLKMYDAQGKSCSLKDIVGGGKYTYIDFWATWCGPCCKEIPFLEKLVSRYKGNSRLRFVSISVDENKEAWLKKLAADKPAWAQYNIPKAEQNACNEAYGISGIPRFMVFDKQGKMLVASAKRPSDEEIKTFFDSLK